MRGTIVTEYDDVDGCDIEGCKGHLLIVKWPDSDVTWEECSSALTFHNDGSVSRRGEQGDTRVQGDTPSSVTLQQAVETGYFIGCGERAISAPPIDVEHLYSEQDAEENTMGDGLLAFLLRELVFSHGAEGSAAWDIARGRIDNIRRQLDCVAEALDTYQPEELE